MKSIILQLLTYVSLGNPEDDWIPQVEDDMVQTALVKSLAQTRSARNGEGSNDVQPESNVKVKEPDIKKTETQTKDQPKCQRLDKMTKVQINSMSVDELVARGLDELIDACDMMLSQHRIKHKRLRQAVVIVEATEKKIRVARRADRQARRLGGEQVSDWSDEDEDIDVDEDPHLVPSHHSQEGTYGITNHRPGFEEWERGEMEDRDDQANHDTGEDPNSDSGIGDMLEAPAEREEDGESKDD